MKKWLLGLLGTLAFSLGCSSPGNPTGSTSGTSGGGGSANPLCIPGQQVACACPGGIPGAQSCNQQGNGFEPCQCAPDGTGGTGGMGTGGMGTGGMGTGGTGGMGTGGMGTGGMGTGGMGTGGMGMPLSCKVPGSCMVAEPIPVTSGAQLGMQYNICPGGSDPLAIPPLCMLDADVGSLVMSGIAETCNSISATGTIKVRIANVPVDEVYAFIPDSVTVQTGATCGAPEWVNIPVQIQGNGVASNNGSVRFGCDLLKITTLEFDQNAVNDSLQICGGNLSPAALSILTTVVHQWALVTLEQSLRSIDRERACLDIDAGSPSPVPAPCMQTPCLSGAACSGGDCGASSCVCGTCMP